MVKAAKRKAASAEGDFKVSLFEFFFLNIYLLLIQKEKKKIGKLGPIQSNLLAIQVHSKGTYYEIIF